MIRIRKYFGWQKPQNFTENFFPDITFIVAAFNEEDFISEKIQNTLSLDYPPEKFHIIFVTDGSTDNTPAIIKNFEKITVLHIPERQGKVAAVHRAMSYVQTPVVIFSDANTLLNKESLKKIVRHYQNPNIGGVAGEKKVLQAGALAGAGESLYWRYESYLKKLDYDFNTVVGAAGELFSIRTELYEFPGEDILLDDFVISLRVCMRGYRIAYEPESFAVETGSLTVIEEKKRKIRISAGAFQSMILLSGLLNIFKYPKLSFQYISHRVLRWTLCPIFLPLIFLANIILIISGTSYFYTLTIGAQILFYILVLLQLLLRKNNKKSGFLYVPYYFAFMNFSMYVGFFRFLMKKQSVLWEKATRTKLHTTMIL